MTTTYEGVESPNKPIIVPHPSIPVRLGLYISILLVLIHPFQFGWSISQLNFSTFHDSKACDARPVVPGTCLMFPGHTSSEWMWVVNAWVIGGMLGALSCGRFADQYGRKRALLANAILMLLSALIQAIASHIEWFILGRFVAGIVSGSASAMTNVYINEISPPFLRNQLGVMFQFAVGLGIVIVGSTFFFLNTSTGWRWIGGIPGILGAIFILGSNYVMESPTWLLEQGRQDDAKQVLERIYGQEYITTSFLWVQDVRSVESDQAVENTVDVQPWHDLFKRRNRYMVLIAAAVAMSQQLCGINAVFFYSSSFFKEAGLKDDRIGSMVVNVVNFLPAFIAGTLGTRFGTRRLLIHGHLTMFIASIGITITLVVKSATLSIIFTAAYVAAFGLTIGSFSFPVVASIFPDHLRSCGTSLCLFANWCSVLLVGMTFPYVSDALGGWGFVPFVVFLGFFGIIIVYWLPDVDGKTSDEIETIFQQYHTSPLAVQCEDMS